MRVCLLFFFCLSAKALTSCHAPRPAETKANSLPQPASADTSLQGCTLLFEIDQKADFLATDPLLNTYLALADGRILRYDSTGSLTAQFGNFLFGSPSYIDLSRPLRPLVFYPDFARVIILDTRLAELANFSLQDAGLIQCTALARARDQGIWAYEASQGILYKLDEQGHILLQSNPLDLHLDLSRFSFEHLRISNHYLLLCDPREGIALFDAFGRFLRFVERKNIRAIQSLQDDLFLLTGKEKILFYQAENDFFQPLSLPCGPFETEQVAWQGKRFYLRQEEKIIVLLLSNMQRE